MSDPAMQPVGEIAGPISPSQHLAPAPLSPKGQQSAGLVLFKQAFEKVKTVCLCAAAGNPEVHSPKPSGSVVSASNSTPSTCHSTAPTL